MFVKGLQHGQAFVQTRNPVFFIEAAIHNMFEGKPEMRSIIVHLCSLIAQNCQVKHIKKVIATKLQPSKIFERFYRFHNPELFKKAHF